MYARVFGFAYFVFATICFHASLRSNISSCVIISAVKPVVHIFGCIFVAHICVIVSLACKHFLVACTFLMLSLCIFSVTFSLRAFVELYRVHIFRFILVAVICVIVL